MHEFAKYMSGELKQIQNLPCMVHTLKLVLNEGMPRKALKTPRIFMTL